MRATQDGCAEAPRRALPGTEARDTRCGQSPLLLSCHLPHHGVRYAAECCQYAAERASILAPERCCDDRSLSSAKEGSQTSTFSRAVLPGKPRRFKSRQGRNVSHVMYEFLHRLCNYITLRLRVLHYVAPSLPTTLPCAHHTLCSYLVVAHVVLRARHEILVSIHLLPH